MEKYLRTQYHLAMLDFKCATSSDAQWEARKNMARIERLAVELFSLDFCNSLRKSEELEVY